MKARNLRRRQGPIVVVEDGSTRLRKPRPLLRAAGLLAAGIAAAAVAIGLLVVVLGPAARWATPVHDLHGKEKADAVNATRQVILAALGGLVVLIGAGFTARTFFLTRRGQFTDRYTKAIGLLASERLTERLGGIYALEQLMAESAQDHPTVVEVLAAFIRERTRGLPAEPELDATDDPREESRQPGPATDVQAALTVLGRRPRRPEESRINLSHTVLRHADMTAGRWHHAFLIGADLRHARLNEADLRDVRLYEARLQRAQLRRARLQHANVVKANLGQAALIEADLSSAVLALADLTRAALQGAVLCSADLAGAIMVDAHLAPTGPRYGHFGLPVLPAANLSDADLRGARLRGTDLRGVDLSSVHGLARDDLDEALTDAFTKEPSFRSVEERDDPP